jgi:hypothetical protein
MKKYWMFFLVVGFVAGVSYIVSCGSGSSTNAQDVTAASDVTYDNTSSGLAATNVQDAMDDINNDKQNLPTTAGIVGTWTGDLYWDGDRYANSATLTFTEEGEFTCEADASVSGSKLRDICTASGGESRIYFTTGSALVLHPNGGGSNFTVLNITMVSDSSLSIIIGANNTSYFEMFSGDKQ